MADIVDLRPSERPTEVAANTNTVLRAESRALVVVAPATETDGTSARVGRPNAPFVAQLIATHDGSPQTRNLRRASTDDAGTSYRLTVTRLARALPRNGTRASLVA